jgi:hypothetical protein
VDSARKYTDSELMSLHRKRANQRDTDIEKEIPMDEVNAFLCSNCRRSLRVLPISLYR